MSPEQLKEILEEHGKWVESGGKEGKKANLQKAVLWRAKLQGANLDGANLQKAVLWKANLREANLFGANLQKADLRRTNLREADLRKANLREASLSGANGLTAPQVKQAKNWKMAFYSDDFLKELGLPSDHNKTLKKKLAELEKKKKEAVTKK